MYEWLTDANTWVAIMKIIGINIVLSGDNAVVIALACRNLPPVQQKKGIFFGGMAAIVLRIILTVFAVVLLTQPYLKLVGSVLLLWIAVKLVLPDDENSDGVEGQKNLYKAIKTILVADLVMSLDNVLGVAAVANGDIVLLTIGLIISMPLIIYGSTLILKLMTRFPIVITLGAALLGYVAGEMAVTDSAIEGWLNANAHWAHMLAPAAGAAFVVLIGKLIVRHRQRRPEVTEISGVEQEPSEPHR